MKCVQFWDVSLTWPVFTPTPTHQISAPWGHPWAVNTGLKFFSLSFFCILLTLKCYHISFDAHVISNILTKAQMQYMYPVWDLKKIPLQIKFHSCRGFGKWVSKPVFGISFTEKRSRMSKSILTVTNPFEQAATNILDLRSCSMPITYRHSLARSCNPVTAQNCITLSLKVAGKRRSWLGW